MGNPPKSRSAIRAGMNGRFFPGNWRPALDEIAFAEANGFHSLQFGGRETGLDNEGLGAPISEVASRLRVADITGVMEIVVRISKAGTTALDMTPLDLLHANLPAIVGLPCESAHWHLVHTEPMSTVELVEMELALIPQFEAGVALAAKYGFRFGFEHNEVNLHSFFNEPERCQHILDAVPGLHFVWDFNHTALDSLDAYKRMIPRMSMLHVSDTPLPETNYHLPLGLGNIDFNDYFESLYDGGFNGAAILEIGGLPKSGGYGKDTDEALIDSLQRIKGAIVDIE